MKQPNSTPTTDLLWRETAAQTAGPYVHIGLALQIAGLPPRDEEIWNQLAAAEADGERIEVVGTVIDGNGELVKDALLEIWQADAQGQYQCDFDLNNAFNSFGRTATTAESGGEWALTTVKPGCVSTPDGRTMAPHINLAVFARGVNLTLNTRMYFADEAEANANCPVFQAVPSANRQQTLLAHREQTDAGRPRYRFDIRLQGDRETVFFDF